MNLQYKKNPITFGVIGICVLIYTYTFLTGDLRVTVSQALEIGALYPALVVEFQEYYRLIMANFIHFDILHIACNCYSLYVIGSMMGLENLLKTKRYLFLIVISMLFTTGIPCILYIISDIGSHGVMAGLSGVVFGLIGGMLMLAIYFKGAYLQVFKQISNSVLLMLVISVIVPSISLVGHVAGLLGGMVGMLILIRFAPIVTWQKQPKEKEHIIH